MSPRLADVLAPATAPLEVLEEHLRPPGLSLVTRREDAVWHIDCTEVWVQPPLVPDVPIMPGPPHLLVTPEHWERVRNGREFMFSIVGPERRVCYLSSGSVRLRRAHGSSHAGG